MFIPLRYGTQQSIRFALVKRGVVDLAATADWTPATGDTKISKDGGNVANTTNNPSAVGGTGSVLWTLTLTAAETQASEVVIQIVDSATKAVEDQTLICRTLPAPVYDALYGGTYKVNLVQAPTVLEITTQQFNSDATSHSVVLPTFYQPRDLFVVIFVNDGNAPVTTPTGWTLIDSTPNSTIARLSIYARIVDGGEASTDFVTGASEQAVAILIRIQAGTYDPDLTLIAAGVAVTGTSTTPDPPTISAIPGVAQNNLVLAVYGADDQAQATAYPADFQTGTTIQGTNATGASAGVAMHIFAGSSVNPGTFTIASQEWIAQTVIIKPARPGDAQTDAVGHIVSDGSNSTTTFATSRTETTNDYWKDAYIRMTSGLLKGQVKRISAYTGSTKFITVTSAFTGIPAAGDNFDLITE